MIDIQNINFKYAGSKEQIFSDFSLQLNENNIYGLLGKNGTGKSTLLYLISGLLHPQGGTVTVDGYASRDRRPEMLEEIFIVPEEFELPAMTLDEYVRINQPFYPRFSREVLRSCLEDFDLPTSLKLQSLSMGQKKKVFMSFALAAGTRLLLMDEPTNGLDIPSKTQFRRAVANNMSDDRTLIISTHQVHDVEALLDHILILTRSRLLLDASVGDICEKYAFEFRSPGSDMSDVVYSEPSMQGNAVIAERAEGMNETQLNLELLFNAVSTGKILM
ncbi:MAG: ABC transporter ATP-binding protein [Prevotella sp.]|nr:ABC transporter ATP-binding protein [Prevotella sp.]